MYKKKKMPIHYIILISIPVLILTLSIFSKVISDERKLTMPEKIIKDAGLFINKIVYKPIQYFEGVIKEQKVKKNLYKKYQDLENRIKKTESLEAYNQELNSELNKMKELLELNNTLSSSKYLNASVINRNLGYWFNTITIDKGTHNGVMEDMPVIVNNGLIGKIITTTNFNSTVKLLTSEDVNNKVSVKINIGNDYIYGILSNYDSKQNLFIVEGIDQNTEIPIDSNVITSGLGNLFPSGILIGKVKNIKTDNFDLAKIVEVKSLVDFNDLSFVTILMKEVKE